MKRAEDSIVSNDSTFLFADSRVAYTSLASKSVESWVLCGI